MLTFPYSVLKARSFTLDIVGQVVSGGVTPSGQQQRVNASGGGLWALRLEFARFDKPDQIRAWRVIQYGSQGGVVPVNIAICDIRQAPRPSNWIPGVGVPHSDDSPFSDESLYASSGIVAQVYESAPRRATTLRVIFEGDSVPLGGEFFSIPYGEGRQELHVVLNSTEIVSGIFELTIEPPLRAAHPDGDVLNFDHPTGTFVLAQSDAMSMSVDYGRFGNAQGAFIEYLG